jgi:glycine/D-amino acid oxidase-like deaminating enzyme
VDKKNLLPGNLSAVSFTTVTIDVPVYLNYLLCRFLARGGAIVRGSVQHIDEVIEGGTRGFSRARVHTPVNAVVVCAGLGARTLGGVEDKNVFPLRGQTVLLRAPWIKFGRTITSAGWSYMIPRRSGDVRSSYKPSRRSFP